VSKEQDSGTQDALPELDFATFVLSIIGTAFVHLGDAPHPEVIGRTGGTTDQPQADGPLGEPNLMLAQQDIELLSLLQQKTQGNLTGEEERVLGQGLTDLRMRFVEVSKRQ
jgi:hypothetical protein